MEIKEKPEFKVESGPAQKPQLVRDLHPWRATKELGQSFTYAFAGLLYTLHSQRNMRFHVFFAIFASAFSVAFRLPAAERGIMLIVICLVPAFEIINTSMESLTDTFVAEWNERAKRAKDAAAGAVLVMALLSLALAAYILLPQFSAFFHSPDTAQLTSVSLRMLTALVITGCLLVFWALRSIRYMMRGLLTICSAGIGAAAMALCIAGRDPSAWGVINFLSTILLNAFARLEFKVRILKEWEPEKLPFDTAGFKIIIPSMVIGNVIGAVVTMTFFVVYLP